MTENAWRRVTGGELIPYFRPPYGSHDARTDAAVAATETDADHDGTLLAGDDRAQFTARLPAQWPPLLLFQWIFPSVCREQ